MALSLVLFCLFIWCFIKLLDFKFCKDFKRVNKKQSYFQFVDYILRYDFSQEIPAYKFYSDIIWALVKLKREHGVNIKVPCLELRKAAQKDYRKEKRIYEELSGLMFQYICIGIFTWFFIFSVQTTLSVHFDLIQLGLLLIWQLFGLVVGLFLFKFLRERLFSSVGQFFYSAYIFRALIMVSRPVSEVISSSRLEKIKLSKQLGLIHKRFFMLIQQLKQKGQLPLEELTNIIQDLWDFYEDQLFLLKRYILALKLFLILFFVFPGFLFAIYLSMQSVSILA